MLFDDKVRKSFKGVKRDMTGLKQSVHDWVLYLNTNQRAMLDRVERLERRVKKLEAEKDQLNQWVY
jgi:polyhydroxyalkanoate synthesis regulator phasin